MTFTEIFFTILIIWILFRVFRSGSEPRSGSSFTFHTHHHHPKPEPEGKTRVHKTGTAGHKDIKGGEYVEYEEIKD